MVDIGELLGLSQLHCTDSHLGSFAERSGGGWSGRGLCARSGDPALAGHQGDGYVRRRGRQAKCLQLLGHFKIVALVRCHPHAMVAERAKPVDGSDILACRQCTLPFDIYVEKRERRLLRRKVTKNKLPTPSNFPRDSPGTFFFSPP